MADSLLGNLRIPGTDMHLVERHGKKYAYESRWVDGRCIKLYVGTEAASKDAVQADASARGQRIQTENEWLTDWALGESARKEQDRLCKLGRLFQQIVLVAAGFRLHNGFEWRG